MACGQDKTNALSNMSLAPSQIHRGKACGKLRPRQGRRDDGREYRLGCVPVSETERSLRCRNDTTVLCPEIFFRLFCSNDGSESFRSEGRTQGEDLVVRKEPSMVFFLISSEKVGIFFFSFTLFLCTCSSSFLPSFSSVVCVWTLPLIVYGFVSSRRGPGRPTSKIGGSATMADNHTRHQSDCMGLCALLSVSGRVG